MTRRGTAGRAGADPPRAGGRERGGGDPAPGARRAAGDARRTRQVRRHVAWGPGPRAAQALMLACRARALLDGRLAPSIDDVAALAPPVLRHRMALNFSARADGVLLAEVIERMIGRGSADGRAPAVLGPPRRGAGCAAAAAAGRGRAGRGHRGAGRAWPSAGGPGRQFLAVPPVRGRRCRDADRLAAVGASPTAPSSARPSGRRRRRVALWRDGSASMRWRSRGQPRRKDRAGRAAAAGAGVAAAARRRAGAADRLRRSAPRGGRAALDRLAAALPRLPDGDGRAAAGAACRATPAWCCSAISSRHYRRSRRQSARLASVPVAGTLVQVLDPAEALLPYTGRIRFRGLEREPDALVPRVEGVRDGVCRGAGAAAAGAGGDLRRGGVRVPGASDGPAGGGGAIGTVHFARRHVTGLEGLRNTCSQREDAWVRLPVAIRAIMHGDERTQGRRGRGRTAQGWPAPAPGWCWARRFPAPGSGTG